MMQEPISVPILQRVVRSALKNSGLRNSVRGHRPLLSDLALDVCPKDWLFRLFPKIERKVPKGYFSAIDNSGRGAGPSQGGAILALALLYEDPDECANKLLSLHATTKSDSDSAAKPHLPAGYWNSDQPVKLYLKHQANEAKIAEELGLNLGHVQRSLRAVGLPPGSLILRPAIKRALKEFLRGNNMETVIARNGLTSETFKRLFRYNIYVIKPPLN